MVVNNFFYKHINCIDVIFYLVESTTTDNLTTIKGYWYNIHDTELLGIDPHMCDDTLYEYTITNKDLNNWYMYDIEENRYRKSRGHRGD